MRDAGGREKELFENALKLEGLFRQTTKHASGIVISNRPLVEDVPLFVDQDGSCCSRSTLTTRSTRSA